MLTLVLAAAQAAATPVTVPPQPQLTEQIRAADAACSNCSSKGRATFRAFAG